MRKQKRRMLVLLPVFLLVLLTGCGKLGSIVNDIHGSLIGNNYTVYTYIRLVLLRIKNEMKGEISQVSQEK